ncbi:MAG: DUF3473 domain-containing protein [Magnetococcales bacterium]|nr:DUF3473 domain-containing protein [Magnetococcales bacterium]
MLPPDSRGMGRVHAFTVDLEEYFQVAALEPRIPRSTWEDEAEEGGEVPWPSRVEEPCDLLLGMLADHGARATFFILGWVARRHPELIRRIAREGHEIASHGWSHRRVSEMTPDAFRQETMRTKAVLESLSGAAVTGYRAASFSIGPREGWALSILAETGHRYSSSIAPIQHDHYGWPEASRHPWRPVADGPLEIPPAVVELGGRRWPVGGGGFFRFWPYPLFRGAWRRLERREDHPSVFYCHPWELDPDQPLPEGLPWKNRWRHTLNLGRARSRMERLLGDFRWGRMDETFAPWIAGEREAPRG